MEEIKNVLQQMLENCNEEVVGADIIYLLGIIDNYVEEPTRWTC